MDNLGTEREQKFRDRVRQFVQTELNPLSLQVELESHIPEKIVDKMRAMKLFGLAIPKEYGSSRSPATVSQRRESRSPEERYWRPLLFALGEHIHPAAQTRLGLHPDWRLEWKLLPSTFRCPVECRDSCRQSSAL